MQAGLAYGPLTRSYMARLSVRGRRYLLVLGTCAVTPYHVLVYRVLHGAGGYAVSTQPGRRQGGKGP